jgi:hypothetical protein
MQPETQEQNVCCLILAVHRSDYHAVTSSWTLQESKVESYEHQDNSYIHHQPFPEPVSEKQEIHSNYNGCHQHDVKYHNYLFPHFQPPLSKYKPVRNVCATSKGGSRGDCT